MRFGCRAFHLVPALLLAACGGPTAPDGPEVSDQLAPAFNHGGPPPKVFGNGVFDAGVPVRFEFNAKVSSEIGAHGHLRFLTTLGGEAIDFKGRVTCLAVDRANRRAWIGGVIVANRSTHASFTTPIHAVGKDIWFRVVDYGSPGSGTPDRTTFVGFEGGGGILTSAEYCEAKIWVDGDARTGPLLSGNLSVR